LIRRHGLRPVANRSQDLLVEAAELEEADRRLTVVRKPTDPVSYRRRSLDELTAGFPPDAGVRRVMVLAGNALLTADFDRMILSSEPNSPVTRMARLATRLLAFLTESEARDLARFLDSKQPI
jgi:hypothetical protein